MINKKVNVNENDILESIFESMNNKIDDITSEEYIKWLDNFTIKNPYIVDDFWVYDHSVIKKSDYKNIEKLGLFYEFIEKYAQENYIKVKNQSYGICYSIKYNNIGFNIGMLSGQGFTYFCERIEVKDDFIDYFDIKNNIKQKNTDNIKKRLQQLSSLIEELLNENIPVDSIEDTTENTLKKVLYGNKK